MLEDYYYTKIIVRYAYGEYVERHTVQCALYLCMYIECTKNVFLEPDADRPVIYPEIIMFSMHWNRYGEIVAHC